MNKLLNVPHEEIVTECGECSRHDGKVCSVYIYPKYWWEKRKGCPMATHIKRQTKEPGEKVRVGQQKQQRKKK